MSKSYKNIGKGGPLRSPRGRRQALINKTRPGAVPPDAWDDIDKDRICRIPLKIATKLLKMGTPEDVVRKKIIDKFHLQSWQATSLIDIAKNRIKRFR